MDYFQGVVDLVAAGLVVVVLDVVDRVLLQEVWAHHQIRKFVVSARQGEEQKKFQMDCFLHVLQLAALEVAEQRV